MLGEYPMAEEDIDMEEVAKHTRGLQSDRGLTSGEAAMCMAEQLDGVTAADIIREL